MQKMFMQAGPWIFKSSNATTTHLPEESIDELDKRAHGVQLKLALLQHPEVDVNSGQSNLWNSRNNIFLANLSQPLADTGQT